MGAAEVCQQPIATPARSSVQHPPVPVVGSEAELETIAPHLVDFPTPEPTPTITYSIFADSDAEEEETAHEEDNEQAGLQEQPVDAELGCPAHWCQAAEAFVTAEEQQPCKRRGRGRGSEGQERHWQGQGKGCRQGRGRGKAASGRGKRNAKKDDEKPATEALEVSERKNLRTRCAEA